jgi:hypothetical protein
MYPLTVLLGIILGSTFSIALGLAVVSFVFWLLKSEYPRLQSEFVPLIENLGLFIALTAAAAVSFYGELKRRRWRAFPQILLLAALLGTGWYYWPT